MSIKRLCLIAALLGMPAAANAAEITIKVPVEITNGPSRPIHVVCYVGIGSADTNTARAGSSPVPRSSGAKTADFKGNVSVRLKPSADFADLDRATHYRCSLVYPASGDRFQEIATPNPSVIGTIP